MPTTSMMRFSWSMSAWLRKCPLARHEPFSVPRTPDLGALPRTCSPTAGDSKPRWPGMGGRGGKTGQKGRIPPLDPHQKEGALAQPSSPVWAKDTVTAREEGLSLEQLSHDAAHGPDVHCWGRSLRQSVHPKSLLRELGGCLHCASPVSPAVPRSPPPLDTTLGRRGGEPKTHHAPPF